MFPSLPLAQLTCLAVTAGYSLGPGRSETAVSIDDEEGEEKVRGARCERRGRGAVCEEGKGHVRGTDLMLCTRFRKKARNLSGQLSWRENEENTGRTERVRHCRLSALVGI